MMISIYCGNPQCNFMSCMDIETWKGFEKGILPMIEHAAFKHPDSNFAFSLQVESLVK